MAEVRGTFDPKFDSVREQLEKNLDVGDDVGASVAVFYRGEPVVDIWGGYQDVEKLSLIHIYCEIMKMAVGPPHMEPSSRFARYIQ